MKYRALNRWLLERLSVYLNEHERAITLDDLRALTDCGISEAEAFSMLLAGLFGLDIADNEEHRAFYNRYFPEMVRCLDAEIYRADPYYANIRIPEKKLGRWQLGHKSYAPCEGFVCGDMREYSDGRMIAPIGFFTQEFSYPCVLEDGREWMLITPNEIETMRPAIAKARGNVLALGLGLGYFAYMAARKPEVQSVTVVERDRDVISLFRSEILPQFPVKPKIEIIEYDAFSYVESVSDRQYDFAFADLWHDAQDGVPMYLRLKALEKHLPGAEFAYWIEPTLRCYLP